MKNTALVALASLFLLMSMLGTRLATTVSTSTTLDVNPGGSIQQAIDSAQPGGTIFVHSGTYYEHVVVNKSVTLVGEDSSTTIIDGSGTWIVVSIDASNVEIRGFTVQNGSQNVFYPFSGIQIGKNCVNNTIRDCIIRNNVYGIGLEESNDNIVVGNKIMNSSWAGIHVIDSDNNYIHDNIIKDNSLGVWITSASSTFNKLYHNNFINNSVHALSLGLNTRWDNGAEGNYWEGYTGQDQNGDGIVDTQYTFSFDVDEYPLMEEWSLFRTFRVPWNGENYQVTTFCNATVASFRFNQSLAQISFNVTGPTGAIGFCNVAIPNTLLWGSFTVLVNGESQVYSQTPNATHNSLYFTFQFQSTSKVQIIGTEVVPEFPTWASILLVFVVFTVIIAINKRRPPSRHDKPRQNTL